MIACVGCCEVAGPSTRAARAFENDLELQNPSGCADLPGFTAAGALLAFVRRRSMELKHSRV